MMLRMTKYRLIEDLGGQPGLDDPAAADYFVAVVEDGGLAGGDGALGFVEGGKDFFVAVWI